jgi:hypothetical protein
MLNPHKRGFLTFTVGRFVIALLFFEAALLLLERLRLSAGDQHKGWAVLVALAAWFLGVVGILLACLASRVLRWRLQFTLRSLLTLVVGGAIPCSWLATELQTAARQKEAVEAIRASAGSVTYERESVGDETILGHEARAPQWLRSILGDDFFTNVDRVAVVTVGGLRQAKCLPQLRFLHVSGRDITDDALVELEDLKQIEVLSVDRATGDEAGFKHLKGLTRLRELCVCGGNIHDADLQHLGHLHQLEILYLDSLPKISDAGLKHLKGLTKLRRLTIFQAAVTDAGFDYLAGMTQLECLELDFRNVSDAGLPKIAKLKQLQTLDLTRSRISRGGIIMLRHALPGCQIRPECDAPTSLRHDGTRRESGQKIQSPLVGQKVTGTKFGKHRPNREINQNQTVRREERKRR